MKEEIKKLIKDINLYGIDWGYCVDYELSDQLIDAINKNCKSNEDVDNDLDLLNILKRLDKQY